MSELSSILAAFPPLPAELPVIVLEDCYHLPGTLLPLCIFEQRYRKMLAHALETQRMFCVANSLGSLSDDSSASPQVYPEACAGLIQSCMTHPDGTSHLVLLGVKRVSFTAWRKQGPFFMAQVQPIETLRHDPLHEGDVLDRALDLVESSALGAESAVKSLLSLLSEDAEPEMACDILSYHFIREPESMRYILKEPSLLKRLQRLESELGKLHAEPTLGI